MRRVGDPVAPAAARRARLLPWLIVLALAPVLGLAGLLSLEQRDSACASCHLPPEATFVARARADAPSDLASAHAALDAPTRCIDCHAWPGPAGRLRTLGLAATDGWSFLRGDYVVVGDEYLPLGHSRHPMGDAPCLACHAELLEDAGFESHHHDLLDAPEAPPELDCAACHASHRPHPEPPWLDDADLAAACEACHAAMGGPEGVWGQARGR